MEKEILDAFTYVANQPMFWGSMGFTTAIAMFVGVILYDGHIDQAQKGTLSVLSYAAMIFWTTFIRLRPPAVELPSHQGKVFAGLATIIYLILFWLIGVGLGVMFFHRRCKE